MKNLTPFLTLLLVVLVTTVEHVVAAGPPVEWEKTLGGSGFDFGWSVRQTSDGGYIIVGDSNSFGAQFDDVYLVKTDPNGNKQWEKTFGRSSYDSGWSVRQTTDKGYIIAGYTWTSEAGDPNVYLIKTDPNGNKKWEKMFGESGPDRGWSVQQTTDKGYIITGDTISSGTEDPNVYLMKTDVNGNMEWLKTFGGSYSDSGDWVQQTGDGGYIIAGETSSFDAEEPNVYLIKTDLNGKMEWDKTFGGTYWDDADSVHQTIDNGYIIVGETESFGEEDPNVYLIKTDANGNLQWQKTFGGTNREYGSCVQQTTDGGYIVAGSTWSFGAGDPNVYLIKTDPNGKDQWQKSFGGSNFDIGWSVQQTSDGGYIIAGTTYSYGEGPADVYLIKVAGTGDIDGDSDVDFNDYVILANQWRQPTTLPSADIAPPGGDGIVDFLDLGLLVKHWLEDVAQ